MKKDVYTKEVEYFEKHPEEIYQAWTFGSEHSPLFDACGVVRCERSLFSAPYGCLTQVKSTNSEAATPALTKAIQSDKTLPSHPRFIEPKHLPRFAYWQRKIDKMFKTRPAPKAPARAKS